MKHLLSVLLIAVASVAYAADVNGLRIGGPIAGAGAGQNFALDAATDHVAWTFMAEDTFAATGVRFIQGTRTGSTTLNFRVSIQGVNDTNGAPNGTIAGVGLWTPVNNSSQNGLAQSVTLTHDSAGNAQGSVAITRGTFYTIVLEPCDSGHPAPCPGTDTIPDGTNLVNITRSTASSIQYDRSGTPFSMTSTDGGTGWAKSAETPLFGIASSTKTYGIPIQAITATSISIGSEDAMVFNIPSTVFGTYKVRGFRANINVGTANKTSKFFLYEHGNHIPLQSSNTWDSDISRVVTTNQIHTFSFAGTLATLNGGTTYRIGISPQDTTNNIALSSFTFASAQDAASMPGGDWFGFSGRSGCVVACDTTTTAWTDDYTRRPVMELILEDITVPAGGGNSGSSHAVIH
jgi:hypothetical protein